MDAEYQEAHLNFVSNNNGSSIQDILLAGLPLHLCPLAVGLLSVLLLSSYPLFCGVVECFVLLLPPLLNLTIFADTPMYVNSSLSLVILLLIIILVIKKKPNKDLKRLWDLRISEDGILDSVTTYRASMLLVTAICILAIDFPVFPRRFGKTETYGYGLMDLGVGGFVFVAGLTAPEGRGKEITFSKTVKSALPLLLLGTARLLVVSLSGYHSNITEYGLHWNFFFSLFFVKVLGSLFVPLLPDGKALWIGAVSIAVLYEGLLCFGLVDWLLSEEERVGLLDSNREGVFSLLGYLALYLAGVSWAKEIFVTPLTCATLVDNFCCLTVWSGLMWGSLIYANSFFLPPSRRMVNYTFFTFVVAYNLSILAGYVFIEIILIILGQKVPGIGKEKGKASNKKKLNQKQDQNIQVKRPVFAVVASRCPQLLKAISYNGLAFFLLANVLTGCINLLVPSVETTGCPAIIIIAAYLFALAATASALYAQQIKLLKF